MAIVWRDFNNGARLGIEVTIPTPAVGATSVVATVDYYMQMNSLAWFSNMPVTFTLSGTGSGARTIEVTTSMAVNETKHLVQITPTIPLQTSAHNRTFGVSAMHFGQAFWASTSYSPQLTVSVPAQRETPTVHINDNQIEPGMAYVGWFKRGVMTSIEVERSVNGGGYLPFDIIDADFNDGIADWTILPGNGYRYRARAIYTGGVSNWSTSALLPWIYEAPTGLTASRSGNTVTLSWSRDQTVDGFRVERRINGGSWSQIAAVGTNTTTYSTTVAAGNKYEYRVRDILRDVLSPYSQTATVLYPAAAPTALSVARVSDTQHNVSWTRGSTYTGVVVQRQTDGGAWVEVARPSGNLASFSDTTTQANRRYRYRVAGLSAGGQSGFSTASGYIYTTPAVPTGVTAVRVGDDIRVNATGLPPWATGYDVQDETTTVGSNVSLSWVHTAPSPAVTHRYRIRSRRSSGTSNNVTLTSGYSSYSATVQITAPPNPPTGLSPNGGVTSTTEFPALAWKHNPVDSSEQTQYQIRGRITPSGTWVSATITTSSTEQASFLTTLTQIGALAAYTAGGATLEWQVRTRGVHATWSGWSATATVTSVTAPTVAVTVTDPYDRPSLAVSWSYSQQESLPQSAWRVRLLDGDNNLLETRDGSGAVSSLTFSTRVEDGESYRVEAEVAASGIWSATGAATFSTAFTPPADPSGFGEWNEAEGAADVHVFLNPGGMPVVSLTVERSVHGEWVEVFASLNFGDSYTFTDHGARSNGVTEYRVTAFTEDLVTSSTVFEVVADSDALWIGGGASYERTARLPYNPAVVQEGGRERGSWVLSGRSLPVPWSGAALTRTIQASAVVLESQPDVVGVDELLDIFQDPSPTHLWRDPDGRVIHGVVSNVSQTRQTSDVWAVSFRIDETSH